MKKFITIFILLFSIATFSQNEIKNDSISTTESFETIIKSYLTKTLDFVEQEGKKVYDLASVEIPEIIKQYLLFESVKYGAYLLLGILFITIILKLLRNIVTVKAYEEPTNCKERFKYFKISKNRWLKRDKDRDDYVSTEEIWYDIVMPIISYLVGIILILINIIPFIKVTFFPKLYLVEKFINIL